MIQLSLDMVKGMVQLPPNMTKTMAKPPPCGQGGGLTTLLVFHFFLLKKIIYNFKNFKKLYEVYFCYWGTLTFFVV